MSRSNKHTVMIQDVDPINAFIFFDGYMYVGGCRHLKNPSWFAPYLTEDCTEPGIRFYCQVFDVVPMQVKDLRRHPKTPLSLDAKFRNHPNWPRWERGLAAIAHRPRIEKSLGFTPYYDPHRLYFLEAPKALGRTVKKAGQKQLPHGFGCSLTDLQAMRDLSDRGRP